MCPHVAGPLLSEVTLGAGQDYERAHEELAKAANSIMGGGGPPGGGYGPPAQGYGPPQGYGGPPPPGYGHTPPPGS